MRHATTVVLIALTIWFGCESVAADSFTGQGQAVIIDSDTTSAEGIAHRAARSQAFTRAMESYVTAGEVDRHQFNLKKGEILRSKHSFITSERVLSRDVKGSLFQLSLEIEVDLSTLGRALGLQGLVTREQLEQNRRDKPTTVVVVAEEINGALNSFPYSVRVIQERLLEHDYPLVDKTSASRAGKHDEAVQAVLNNDVGSARAIALQFDAGLMITGRAVVQKSAVQAGGMQSFGANVALNAIAPDTGRVLATSSASGNYPHVNAITGSRLAVEEAGNRAMDQLLQKLEQQTHDLGTPLRFTVSGVNYQQLTILKKILLKDFPQVVSIDTRGFTGDIARLDVTLVSNTVSFSEELALKNFGGFRLRVLHQSNEKLDVVLITSR